MITQIISLSSWRTSISKSIHASVVFFNIILLMFTGIHLEGILHILSVSIPRYKPCDGSTDTERFFRYSTEEFTSEVLKEAREKEKTRKAEAKATAKAKAQAKAKATARKTKKEKEEEKKALEAEAKQRRKERKQQKKKQAGPGPAQRYSSLFSQGTLGADYSRAGVVEKE